MDLRASNQRFMLVKIDRHYVRWLRYRLNLAVDEYAYQRLTEVIFAQMLVIMPFFL